MSRSIMPALALLVFAVQVNAQDVVIAGIQPAGYSASDDVDIFIGNNGSENALDVEIALEVIEPGGTTVVLTDTIPIVSGSTSPQPFTFSSVDLSLPGTYRFTATATFASDPDLTNNEMSAASPASIPFFEGFESAALQSLTLLTLVPNTTGMTMSRLESGTRVRVLDDGYDDVGQRVLAMDNTFGNNSTSSMSLIIDTSGLDTAVRPDIALDFSFFDHLDDVNATDLVEIRSSTSTEWIVAYDLGANGVDNAWVDVDGLNLTDLLRNPPPTGSPPVMSTPQELGRYLEVRFSHAGDNIINNDGISFDDIAVRYANTSQGELIEAFAEDASATADASMQSSTAVVSALSIGGELDVLLEAGTDSIDVAITDGELSILQTAGSTVELSWDGVDGNATVLNPLGLGGVDLTSGGLYNGLLFGYQADWDFDLTFHTDAANASSASASSMAGSPDGADIFVPFSELAPTLGAGADIANIGAIDVLQRGTTALRWIETAASVRAAMTASLSNDLGNDGTINYLDTVSLSVLLETPLGAPAAQAVNLFVGMDPATRLRFDTLTAGGGVVNSGDTSGDTSVDIDFTLDEGASVLVEFDVVISAEPGTASSASFQGQLTAPGVTRQTDDPTDDTSLQDATVFSIVSSMSMLSLADAVVVDNGDGVAGPGDVIEYTATVSNNGDGPLGGAVLTAPAVDNAPLVNMSVVASQGSVTSGNAGEPTIAVDLGVVEVGVPAIVSWRVEVASALPDAVETLSQQAMLTTPNEGDFNSDDPDTVAQDDATVTALTASPELTIDLSDGRSSVVPGQAYGYSITVDNTGNQAATGVSLSLSVPAGTAFDDGATAAAWVCAPDASAGSSCIFDIGTLSAGSGMAVDFAVQLNDLPDNVPEAIALDVAVSEDGNNGPENGSDNLASDSNTMVATELSLALLPDSVQASNGEEFSLSVALSNGSAYDTGALDYELLLPPGVTLTGPVAWSCGVLDISGASRCTLSTLGLAGGASLNTQIDFLVEPDAPVLVDASMELTVTTSSVDRDPTNNTATSLLNNVDPVVADLAMVKTGSIEAVTATEYAVSYTLVVSSDAAISGVRVVDTLPLGLSNVSWTCTGVGGASCVASGVGDIDELVDLPAAGSVTFQISATARVTAQTQSFDNTASASVPPGASDPAPDNNSDTAALSLAGSDAIFADRFEG